MTLLVQNEGDSPALLQPDEGKMISFTAKGDPSGGDLIRVPNSMVEDTGFLRAVDGGWLTIVQDAEGNPGLPRSNPQAARERQQAQHDATEQVMDRRQDRDMVQEKCIGPAVNGRGGQCGADVIVRAAERGQRPPLCDQHQSLAEQFYLAESGSKGEGATENTPGTVSQEWKRVQIG